MKNRLNSTALSPLAYHAKEKELDYLSQKIGSLIESGEANSWKLIRLEWRYDFALLMDNFGRWTMRLDQSFGTDK